MKTLASLGRTWILGLALAGCAVDGMTDETPVTGEGGGKADGPGSVPGASGSWTREVIDSNSTLWNGGPTGYGQGTSIAIRANGQPIIAYYDASHHCNNGGFGTYSSDALMVARVAPDGWKRRVEACGPEAGYWPRVRVDANDRTHVLFGAGWYTKMQRAFYVRWNAVDARETSKLVSWEYMSSGALALTLDDAGAPIVVANGTLVADDGTKTPLFTASTSQTFAEKGIDGVLHVVGNTMIPEPNNPSTSISRMRYARQDGSGVSVEIPRTAPLSVPLGLVVDGNGEPHILSWNATAMGAGELWHTTRTAAGWVDELVDGNATRTGAMAIGADDELIVVTSGRMYRHPAGSTGWTWTPVTALAGASNPSLAIAEDGTVHVAFQLVGAVMSNRVSRAPVYHATFH